MRRHQESSRRAADAADDVAALDRLEEAWDVDRVVLPVAVHDDNDLAPGGGKPRLERRRLAVVAVETDEPDGGVVGAQLFDQLRRAVVRAVVDVDDLEGLARLAEHVEQLFRERLDVFRFVPDGDDD